MDVVWAAGGTGFGFRGRGWSIRARNLRAPEGELDLVATDGAVTVVVEVKTGRQPAGGWSPGHLPRHRLRSDAIVRRQRAARRLAGARGPAGAQRPAHAPGSARARGPLGVREAAYGPRDGDVQAPQRDRDAEPSLGRVDLIEVQVDPRSRRARLLHFRDMAAEAPPWRALPAPARGGQ